MTKQRRGSNLLLAWRDRGNVDEVQRALITQAEWLHRLGSTHGQRPELAYDEWVASRGRLVADLRDSANALTAALAVEMVVHHHFTFRRAAEALKVSTSAIHGWLQQAKDLGLIDDVPGKDGSAEAP